MSPITHLSVPFYSMILSSRFLATQAANARRCAFHVAAAPSSASMAFIGFSPLGTKNGAMKLLYVCVRVQSERQHLSRGKLPNLNNHTIVATRRAQTHHQSRSLEWPADIDTRAGGGHRFCWLVLVYCQSAVQHILDVNVSAASKVWRETPHLPYSAVAFGAFRGWIEAQVVMEREVLCWKHEVRFLDLWWIDTRSRGRGSRPSKTLCR